MQIDKQTTDVGMGRQKGYKGDTKVMITTQTLPILTSFPTIYDCAYKSAELKANVTHSLRIQ